MAKRRYRMVDAAQPSEGQKYMDLIDFVNFGFLQEANRLFFHPLGLALTIGVGENGNPNSMGIWDCRESAEGVFFGVDDIDTDKIMVVHMERMRHQGTRQSMWGQPIQPPVFGPEPEVSADVPPVQ